MRSILLTAILLFSGISAYAQTSLSAGSSNRAFIGGGYTVEIRDIPERRIASIRVTTTMAEVTNTLTEVLPEIWSYLTELGLEPTDSPMAIYHRIDGNSVEIEAAIAFTGSNDITDHGRITISTLPAGRAAVTTHTGAYQALGKARVAVSQWLGANGLKGNGTFRESYITDPEVTPNPDEWSTEVIYPIE